MAKKLKNRLYELLGKKFGSLADVPSQDELAAMIGVSQGTVSRWKNQNVGRMDSDVVEKFCNFLGCEVGDLLYLEEVA